MHTNDFGGTQNPPFFFLFFFLTGVITISLPVLSTGVVLRRVTVDRGLQLSTES